MKRILSVLIVLCVFLVQCKESTMLLIRCQTDADCPEGQYCGPNGICLPKECTTTADCPEGEICVGFVCVPPPCDLGDKRCSEDGLGYQECLSDGETNWWGDTIPCGLNEICIDGECVSQDECSEGETSCNLAGNVQWCVQNPAGLWVWAEHEICDNAALRFCTELNTSIAECRCEDECAEEYPFFCIDAETYATCGQLESGCYKLDPGICPFRHIGQCEAVKHCNGKLFQASTEETQIYSLQNRNNINVQAISQEISTEIGNGLSIPSLGIDQAKLNTGFVIGWVGAKYENTGQVPDLIYMQVNANIYDAEGNANLIEVARYNKAGSCGSDFVANINVFNLADSKIGIVWQYYSDYYSPTQHTPSTIRYALLQYDGVKIGEHTIVEIQSPFYQYRSLHNYSKSLIDGSKFIVAWIESQYGMGNDDQYLYAKAINPDGSTSVDKTLLDKGSTVRPQRPYIEPLADNRFAISWFFNQPWGDLYFPDYRQAVKVRCFNDPFNSTGEYIINSNTTQSVVSTSSHALDGGNFVVLWTRDSTNREIFNHFFQVLDANCSPVTSEFPINSNNTIVKFTHFSAVKRENNQFLISWLKEEFDLVEPDVITDITLQIQSFGYSGNAVTPRLPENTNDLFLKYAPAYFKGIWIDPERLLYVMGYPIQDGDSAFEGGVYGQFILPAFYLGL